VLFRDPFPYHTDTGINPSDEKVYPGLYKSFETLGYHEFKTTIAREPKTIRVYPQDVENSDNWDTSIVWDRFPHHVHILTIHGMLDTISSV